MNKKILLVIFFLSLGGFSGGLEAIGELPSLSVEWEQPTAPVTIVGTKSDSLTIIPKVYCTNGPCNDLQLTIEYCLGSSCIDYQPICYSSCAGEPISVDLYSPSPPPQNPCNPRYDSGGDYYYCLWNVYIPFSEQYGQTIRLRAKATSSNALTAYATGRQYYVDAPPTITLDNPSSKVELQEGDELLIKWSIGSDPEGDNQRTSVDYCMAVYPYDCTQIYYSDYLPVPASLEYNWIVPNIEPGEYNIIARTWYYSEASAAQGITIVECTPPGSTQDCTTTEGCAGIQTCQADNTWGTCIDSDPFDGCPAPSTTAEVLSPGDGNYYYIGKEIEFESNISCGNEPCTIQWDSNKDEEWNSTDENFSYSGLSIGDHNITLTVTDSLSETASDLVLIHIKPVTTDVFSISDFELIKVEPSDRFAVNGKIRIKAKVNYFLHESVNAKAFLIISDPRTGQAIYGPEPFYLSFTKPGYEDYDLNIDLSNYSFQERENYKVEFLAVSNYVESSPAYFVDPEDPDSAYWDDGEPYYIPENQITEQNKANNSGYLIVELGPTTLRDISNLPETNPILIALILFVVLIISRKRK